MLCIEDYDGEAVPFPWSGWGDVDHGVWATERFRGGVFSGEEQREEGEMGEKIGGGRRMGKRGGRLGFGEGGLKRRRGARRWPSITSPANVAVL